MAAVIIADHGNCELMVDPVTGGPHTAHTTNPVPVMLVGGPAAGGAMFLLNKLIGDQVSRFASVQYSIQGPWNGPKITFDKPFEKH